MKLNKIIFFISIALLCVWFSIALFRTGYNFTKIYSEERFWIGKTDEEKRAMQFGDIHYLLRFVQKNTKSGSHILFFTNNLTAFYIGRYYLYPTKLFGEHEKQGWHPLAKDNKYILIFPVNPTFLKKAYAESNIKNYKKIATFKTKSGQVAQIYQQ